MKTLVFDLDGTLVRLKPSITLIVDVAYLSTLRKEYNFALVTGSSRKECMDALEKTKLDALFDDRSVVTADDVRDNKASGVPFQEIRKRVRGSIVMIGDSESDKLGSQKARIPFVKVKVYNSLAKQQRSFITAVRSALRILNTH